MPQLNDGLNVRESSDPDRQVGGAMLVVGGFKEKKRCRRERSLIYAAIAPTDSFESRSV